MTGRVHDLLLAAARARPDALAIIENDTRHVTWADLAEHAAEAADHLHEAGVGPGDRILLIFENSVEAVAFLFAASLVDASAVVVNARLTKPEIDRTIAHCEPRAVMLSTSVSDNARSHAETLGARDITGSFGQAALLSLPDAQPDEPHDDPAQQTAMLLYTSGTTGAPKAAMMTHTNLIAAGRAAADQRDMTAEDVTYLVLPLSHIFGTVILMAVAYRQSACRLETSFSAERLYDALQQDITILPAVPQMHAHLFHYTEANNLPPYSGNRLKYVSSGGAPLDPAWKRKAEAFYGAAMQNGYGLTETGAGVCATKNAIGDPDISVGRAMGQCTLSLDMTAPGATPAEGIGEILIGGPHVMKGYFRDPDQTAQALTADGWFRSGDLGRFDAEGRLHISGRSKELIIRSGFNVYPPEIEATLTDHPDVIMAGVVGRHVEGNEEVLAFVAIRELGTVTEPELMAFAATRLAPYKRPSRIIVAHDLPAAATGKILKSKLIDSFAAALATPPEASP